MDHKLVLENSSSATVYTALNTITYLKDIKYSNIRLIKIYEMELEHKIRVQKIEDHMQYYDHKDSGLLCGWAISSSQL